MANMNEGLAFVAGLAKKIQQDLHPLQHIDVNYEDDRMMKEIASEIVNLSRKVNSFSDKIQQQYHESIPEQKPQEKSPFAPLPSSEHLHRLRKFNGRD